MTLRLNLGKYLEQHNISAYRVVQVSKLSPNTVYALARKPTKRIDLDTVSAVLAGLESITGESVVLGDLIEDIDAETRVVNPKLEALLKRAKPPLNFKNIITSGVNAKEREAFDKAIREVRQESPEFQKTGISSRERKMLEIMSESKK
jgi:hypothetical protein